MDFGVWFVGVLLVIGGFLILVCWRGGGDFAMDFGFWFCYGFWLGGEIGGWVWFCYEFWVLILLWIFSFDFATDFALDLNVQHLFVLLTATLQFSWSKQHRFKEIHIHRENLTERYSPRDTNTHLIKFSQFSHLTMYSKRFHFQNSKPYWIAFPRWNSWNWTNKVSSSMWLCQVLIL